MAMVLEYPMKLFILLVVIIVLTGMMITYRDKIMSMDLFGNDEETDECNIETIVVGEISLDYNTMVKYSELCFEKNGNGKCVEDSLCYLINFETPINPTVISGNNEYFDLTCSREVTSVYVQYIGYKEKVEIAC